VVAAGAADVREADAGVACGTFDDRTARLQSGGILYHVVLSTRWNRRERWIGENDELTDRRPLLLR
jgi:hypothetical protein